MKMKFYKTQEGFRNGFIKKWTKRLNVLPDSDLGPLAIKNISGTVGKT